MKKFAIIILALLFSVVLVACNSNKRSETGVFSKFDGELETNVTIRVLENDVANEKGYLKELLDAFNKEYAKYGIQAVDANMDQYSDLENDGPYGYGPDVLYQANDILMKYVDGKHILPLPVDKLESYSAISQNAWKVFQQNYGDENYTFAVPVNIQSPMLYYRKDQIPTNWKENYDINNNDIPDMIENWPSLYKYSNEIHSSDPTKFGYMKSIFDSYFSVGYLLSYGAYIFGKDNTDPSDIGINNGNAYIGAKMLHQLAASMNEDCIDDSVTVTAYSKLATGEYFATMTTPDVYALFFDELVIQYKKEGLSDSDARAKAKENLVITTVPKLPVSGDLNDLTGEMKPMTVMGGLHGYAISSYTKAPKASLAFINFATSYNMISKREKMLSIAPIRNDVISEVGGTAVELLNNLDQGYIDIMPSIKQVGQIWTPLKTLFTNLAKDPYRKKEEQVYTTYEAFKDALNKTKQEIYDSIFTLS